MKIKDNKRETEYFELLKCWCDKILELQFVKTGNKRMEGGIFCPSCLMIHGRCWETLYPFLYLADKTGEEKYLTAARRLFAWGENLLCDDGSFYNDAQSTWAATTVFAAAALCEALKYHGHLLEKKEKNDWENRLKNAEKWIFKNINIGLESNINYYAATAGVLALTSNYFEEKQYLEKVKEMAWVCMQHFTKDGLFYGEGKPMNHITKRGCRPVDIGYNVDESLAFLILYAKEMEDKPMLMKLKDYLSVHMEFFLPDGGWDNSFGTRNYKWTYWGSRTTDGCQGTYGVWEETDTIFSEIAYRNLKLLKECTKEGLLYGGPDYYVHGEEACVHHSFSHAKGLAAALNSGIHNCKTMELPEEMREGVVYYQTIDTYKIQKGDYRATVTFNDFCYHKGGHASGGTMTLLWHKRLGPILAASMCQYQLIEAHNMQLSLKKDLHYSQVMGIYFQNEKGLYAQCYDYNAKQEVHETDEKIMITSIGTLVNDNQVSHESAINYKITYFFTEYEVVIEGKVMGLDSHHAEFIMPIIGRHNNKIKIQGNKLYFDKGDSILVVTACNLKVPPKKVFCLSGGFEAYECRIKTNENGEFKVIIKESE